MPFRSPHYVLEPFGRGHRLTRTDRVFEELSELAAAHEALLPELARARSGPLLVDLRDAKGRNDPSFEHAMAGYRRAMFQGFPTVVVLVRTAIGKLQVQRHFVEDGLDGAVITTSEEEAEAALR
jgi:hypothetical protein